MMALFVFIFVYEAELGISVTSPETFQIFFSMTMQAVRNKNFSSFMHAYASGNNHLPAVNSIQVSFNKFVDKLVVTLWWSFKQLGLYNFLDVTIVLLFFVDNSWMKIQRLSLIKRLLNIWGYLESVCNSTWILVCKPFALICIEWMYIIFWSLLGKKSPEESLNKSIQHWFS